jgi:hypothetical protein
LHPESDGPGRAAFIKTITDIKDPGDRSRAIGKLWANLDPQKQAAIDINGLVNSADNVANPVFQAGQAKEIAAKDAFIQKLFTPDPTLRGTPGAWATPAGQVLGNVAMAALPRILQASAFASQIYGATRDRVKEEHPDWTDEQIASNSGISTIAQLAPQEVLIALSHGIIGPIARWATNPVARFGIGGGVHLATGAAGGALMQAGANVAEGQPIGEDVGGAAIQGAIQAVPFAVHGAVSGALTPREGVVSPEAIPKVNQAAPLGEEPVTPPSTTGPVGGTVHGATAETMASGGEETEARSAATPSVTTASNVLGSEPTDEVAQTHQDEVLGVVAHNIFPDLNESEAKDLADRISFLTANNLETDRVRYELQKFLPQDAPTNFGPTKRLLQAYFAFRDGPTELTAKEISVAEKAYNAARNPQAANMTGSLKLPIMWQESARQDLSSAIREQKIKSQLRSEGEPTLSGEQPTPTSSSPVRPAAAPLLGEEQEKVPMPVAPPVEPVPSPEATGATPVSEAEPWVSKIANRFTAERMATGELGQIDSSQGQSTEQMVMQGLQMDPAQRERLINNFSRGMGGDLDTQGAAIRSKEAILSEQSRTASRASAADSDNLELKAQAKAALDEVTAFHNGPVKKFKRVWSDAGRALQREIPVDYTTLNGMKEAYLKGNGKEAPAGSDPRFQKTADAMSKSVTREQVAMRNLGQEIGARTRGNPISDESVRTRLMEIMKDLPCRN